MALPWRTPLGQWKERASQGGHCNLGLQVSQIHSACQGCSRKSDWVSKDDRSWLRTAEGRRLSRTGHRLCKCLEAGKALAPLDRGFCPRMVATLAESALSLSTHSVWLQLHSCFFLDLALHPSGCRGCGLDELSVLQSTMDCEEIQPVHSEGDQPWDFFGGNDAKAETPVLWPPHGKSWLIGKDPDAGRDWGQEEKGTTEDEMAGWHHWPDGHESEWTPGVGDGRRGLVCYDAWGHKVLDTTERLNWTELGQLTWSLWNMLLKLKVLISYSNTLKPSFSACV